MGLLEIKAAYAFNIADDRHKLEFHRKPAAPLAFFQNKLLVLKRDPCHRFERIDVNRKRLRRGRRVLAKRIVRPDEVGRNPVVLHFHLHHFPTLDRSDCRRGIIGVERERAIRSAQIGRAHAGKRLSFRANRREICRNPIHIIGNILFVQNFPESLTMPQLLRRAATQRNHPTADAETVLRALNLRC